MKRFTSFIIESVENEEKLKHLEHLEDHPINAGHEGYLHAANNLMDVHRRLRGRPNSSRITMKYDGSPSIVFGRHPENGKFFVASKSAFNKEPKLNYTPEDIEKNHGHAPGLVSKLKAALEHLPKVTPPTGVYQGDVMHTPEDLKKEGNKVSFTPNTITYSTPANSPQGKAALGSKFGVAVHTAYHGPTLHDMKAQYAPDLGHFGQHKDVHLISTDHDTTGINYSPEEQQSFKEHMKAANRAARQIPQSGHDEIVPHRLPLKTYINSTVRNGTTPEAEGYFAHLAAAHQKGIDKVKTAKAKEAKTAEMNRAVGHAMDNREHIENLLNMHHHLQKAKDILTHNLASKSEFQTSINGEKTKPEGFVVVRNNRPTKFVDRAEFSRANFGMGQGRVQQPVQEAKYNAAGKVMTIGLQAIRMANGKIKRLPPGKSGSSGGGD